MNKFPLSKMQEQFWILYKLFKENLAYNLVSVFRIKGSINIEALRLSVTRIVSRHEILRTNFLEENGKPWQIVNAANDELFEIPLITIDEKLTDNNVPEAILKEIHLPFDLETGPPFRIKLFTSGDNDFILSIVFHHIIIDSHSKEIFSKELSLLYNSIVTNSLPLFDQPSGQYADFSLWQQEWLGTEDAKKMLAEWKNIFDKPDEVLRLPADFIPGKKVRIEGRRKHFVLDKNTSKKIRYFAKKQTITPFTLLLTLYAIFLNRLSGQSSVIIGVPFTNRRKDEFKSTFGCFMNILPIQVNVLDNSTLVSLIEKVRKTLLKAHRIQEIPFLLLNSILGDNDGEALFQVGFTFDSPMKLHFINTEITPLTIEKEGLQLELFITLWEEAENFHVYFEYSNQKFKEESIVRFFNIFKATVQTSIAHPEDIVSELNLTPEEDLHFISKWNNKNVPYEKHLCIHQKFEQQVKKYPEKPALLFNDQSMSYKELNDHANRLANYLICREIKTEDKIGICIDRSAEMMISILGVLKAGAAYLPLNPEYPEERLKSIIYDASPPLILTSKSSSINIPDGIPLVFIDNIINKPFSENSLNPNVKVTSKNLAYVLYTSGSTGKPKGVMIEHHSVLNRLGWMQKAYPINMTDTLLQKTPISFDVSVWELFWWFFNGSKLVLLPKGGEKDAETLIQYIFNYRITVIHFVPSMFASFFEMLITRKLFNKLVSLNRLILSGEALPLKLVKDFNEIRLKYTCPEMINLYGPTEATVDVSYFNCPKENINNVYIGRPIDNTKLFVVNDKDVIQPIGIPGELIITGVNLARGYLNHDDLTDEKFFKFKIPGNKIVKAYRSGDIAKLTWVGELEYLGRRDNQVKIRGFRIELGDIESKILEHPLVSSCAVVVSDGEENRYLIAYVCIKANAEISADELKSYLSKMLPGYMIPTYFLFLDTLPLTFSGKLDRKSLPLPERNISKNTTIPPSNKFEKRLLALWRELLKTENINIDDNFFDIGGNSLLTINLASLIAKEFNTNVNAFAIMEYPNIKEQSKFLANSKKNNYLLKDFQVNEKIRLRKKVNFKTRRNNIT